MEALRAHPLWCSPAALQCARRPLMVLFAVISRMWTEQHSTASLPRCAFVPEGGWNYCVNPFHMRLATCKQNAPCVSLIESTAASL